MTALVDQYLAALVRHDPAGLPLLRGVRFTENTAEIRIGDGLWVGASEVPTTFRIYAVDPGHQPVAFHGVMKEWDKPLIIALRLKVIRGEITLLADVSDSDKTSREEMLSAADAYFEAIEHGQGSLAPFADDCERHENGGQTTHNKTPVPWPVYLGSAEANHSMAIIGTLSCLPYGTKNGWE